MLPQSLQGLVPQRLDVNIPQLRRGETWEVHDLTVNIQLGALIVLLGLVAVVVYAPAARPFAGVALLVLLPSVSRSHLRYRRLHGR
ncbi:hypothetical protein AB0K71_28865 [Streptomyces syringium]|uniref:hypothetical protein n=1 Tax=Streptomyces syringium TaxID=76729 RepID=UPI00341E16D3